MNQCKQHSPVPIESITEVVPPKGRFKAVKEGAAHSINAPRITRVTKVKCFSCGEVIEVDQDQGGQ